MGLGTFFTWFSFTLYFTSARRYSVIWRTFVKAVPTFTRVLAGVMPFLIGTALLAYTMFWQQTNNFSSYSQSQYSLFAMQGGDAL